MLLFVANVMALRRRVQTTSPYVVYSLRPVFAPRMGWHYWRLSCPLLSLPRSPTHQSSPPFVAANNDNDTHHRFGTENVFANTSAESCRTQSAGRSRPTRSPSRKLHPRRGSPSVGSRSTTEVRPANASRPSTRPWNATAPRPVIRPPSHDVGTTSGPKPDDTHT